MRRFLLTCLLVFGLYLSGPRAGAVEVRGVSPSRTALDRNIAARFAPVFMQGLGDQPRADYITNFDFDGDWKGNNNWKNLEKKTLRLRAWVYFSVIETATHYFVHYAAFHPRDYKGDLTTSTLLQSVIRAGIEKIGSDPTGGLADEVALSHENDLEGCLVVAVKSGSDLDKARVAYVETMAHNRYQRYLPAGMPAIGGIESCPMRGQQPVLFVEPRGHGIERYRGDPKELRESVNGVLAYVYKGRSEDPDELEPKKRNGAEVGYAFAPIAETLWKRAQKGTNETYGEVSEFTVIEPSAEADGGTTTRLAAASGKLSLGSAFRGEAGSTNKARPPWGWFDRTERGRPAGEWFFDPAQVIGRHFSLGNDFSRVYTYHPFRPRS